MYNILPVLKKSDSNLGRMSFYRPMVIIFIFLIKAIFRIEEHIYICIVKRVTRYDSYYIY